MRAKITVKMDNAAFTDDPQAELARILKELANELDCMSIPGRRSLRDYNGNTVGELSITK